MSEREEYGAERGSQLRLAAWGLAGVLLIMAGVSKILTGMPDWGVLDFVLIGLLLAGPLFGYELAVRRSHKSQYRAGAAVALLATMLLVWINLAVGIIGSEDNLANGMYVAVLAIAASGAYVARFGADGLGRAMMATAGAQALVTVIAIGLEFNAPYREPMELIFINTFFISLWLGSGWLFFQAARDGSVADA
ncbi:hypothetical protein [Pelagibacterium luteolum]|uniref:Uncharacterized protein n=1 Tax=Pelagibacterium luteolum TaxID=440168 RepID=A0A1G7UVT1_9HYPH|nr:hypothetical protein [Pelagibacterium luteolum]SDG51652.1 hypothetical protein SAMN04487974_103310 [Pelagibacterium luteolum]